MLEGDGARRPQRRADDVLAPLAAPVPVAGERAALLVRQAVSIVGNRRLLEQPAVSDGVDDAVPVAGPRAVDPHHRRVQDGLLDGRLLLRYEGLGIDTEGGLVEQPPVDGGREDVDGHVKSGDAHRILLEVEATIGSQHPRATGATASLPLPRCFG